MSGKIRIGILVVFALAIAWGLITLTRERGAGVGGSIRVSGTIEVTVAQVSFQVPGQMLRRLVTEGENVTNGQVVALLDKTQLEQEAAMRQADVQAAQAALAELEAGSRPEEIEAATAELDMAQADAKRAESEFNRQKDLFTQKVVSSSDFDLADAASRMAKARVHGSEARLALLKKGPRIETIDAAKARLEQVRQAAKTAETRLGYAILTSPLTGVVLTKEVENGEYVIPGEPVITVGDLVHVWLRAYIDETDLGRIRLGQAVKITADTYPGRIYEGRLSFIASQAEFTPKDIQTAKERVKLVYRIKVDIDNTRQELKPGMPADAEIEVR